MVVGAKSVILLRSRAQNETIAIRYAQSVFATDASCDICFVTAVASSSASKRTWPSSAVKVTDRNSVVVNCVVQLMTPQRLWPSAIGAKVEPTLVGKHIASQRRWAQRMALA